MSLSAIDLLTEEDYFCTIMRRFLTFRLINAFGFVCVWYRYQAMGNVYKAVMGILRKWLGLIKLKEF